MTCEWKITKRKIIQGTTRRDVFNPYRRKSGTRKAKGMSQRIRSIIKRIKS